MFQVSGDSKWNVAQMGSNCFKWEEKKNCGKGENVALTPAKMFSKALFLKDIQVPDYIMHLNIYWANNTKLENEQPKTAH